MATVLTLETPELGDRSHLVHDGRLAAAVDPQRDLDRMLALAETAGVRIALVAETHLHNDYVTGGLELARRTGAPYVIGGGADATFDCHPAAEGEVHAVGGVGLRVVATPGHTEGHVAYVVEEARRPVGVLTGGSMLFGTVGRTDLVSAALTRPLTLSQHRSVRRLAATLPDDVAVHPTHGFGSFCASVRAPVVASSTIGEERARNHALRTDDPEAFCRELLGGLTAHPAYYRHMGLINRAGPAALDLGPPHRVCADELARRLRGGGWVVDLRPRRAFAAGHLRGTVGLELGPLFTTYLGWVMPWGMPVTLLGDTEDALRQAQRDIARIGIDRPAGTAVGPVHELGGEVRSYPVSDFAGLARARRDRSSIVVVDVRRDDEWTQGHVADAVHLPLPELEGRAAELPPGTLWVHCAQGYRASVGASLLDRAGRDVVLIDDEWERAAAAGVGIETGA